MKRVSVHEYRGFLEIARLETRLIMSSTGTRLPVVHRAVVPGNPGGPVVIARRTPRPGGFYEYEIDPAVLDDLRGVAILDAVEAVEAAIDKLDELDVSDAAIRLIREQAEATAKLVYRANQVAGFTAVCVGDYLGSLIELRKLLTEAGVIK